MEAKTSSRETEDLLQKVWCFFPIVYKMQMMSYFVGASFYEVATFNLNKQQNLHPHLSSRVYISKS